MSISYFVFEMSSMNAYSAVCLCGKKRLKLNYTNWTRHQESCSISKLKKLNIVNDLSNFYSKKRGSDELEEVLVLPKKSKYFLFFHD
jgi:hypothetical protein